jgi:hypothetical protein
MTISPSTGAEQSAGQLATAGACGSLEAAADAAAPVGLPYDHLPDRGRNS